MLFRAQGFDLLNECVDFLRRQLTGELRHPAFAVHDDAPQVVGGHGMDLFGDQRWSAKMSALGGFTVTLRAVFLEDWVGGQRRIGGRCLGEDQSGSPEQKSDSNDTSGYFQGCTSARLIVGTWMHESARNADPELKS
jgi:hypothetical protein